MILSFLKILIIFLIVFACGYFLIQLIFDLFNSDEWNSNKRIKLVDKNIKLYYN